jgi:hypothetical protein
MLALETGVAVVTGNQHGERKWEILTILYTTKTTDWLLKNINSCNTGKLLWIDRRPRQEAQWIDTLYRYFEL